VPPSSASTRTSESSTDGELEDTDQLAVGEQLTATLDLIFPAIIPTSSVDTNGAVRR